ncbi:MAG: peroxiredoxin [Leptolyngbya sp. SIO3F4]|nr:peroxiredoxin [Leptolyngbya sp. SIO3F4]
MAEIQPGERIPSFTLPDQNGQPFDVDQALGKKNLVIYFYPKDYTPGCTKEACRFRDEFDDFKKADATVIGISSDSPEMHKKFAERYRLPFTLLSDRKNEVRKKFGVKGSLMGLLPGRVTFIADKEGVVRHTFNAQFKAEEHVEEALRVLKELQ